MRKAVHHLRRSEPLRGLGGTGSVVSFPHLRSSMESTIHLAMNVDPHEIKTYVVAPSALEPRVP